MMRTTAAAAGMIVDENVAVPMSDGVTLRVNVFRPDHEKDSGWQTLRRDREGKALCA
jgi:predicted acyl esterase